MTNLAAIGTDGFAKPDVTIVMPCLNEAKWLPTCIANAKEAVEALRHDLGLNGEIIIADNGSTDGSQLIARALGVRVVEVGRRGYGAALVGGLEAANGTYLVMGDADGSYDFRECVAMVRCLTEGADMCMGSRFKGRIEPGAMPWKNRYIGNPALTFVLNLFFRAGVSDAHCGLRALTKSSFDRLDLSGRGMEFASELIIKAALKKLKIVEVPATLSCDLRDRPPHLRPWRDGWRHLRYLLMLSPWAFAAPAALAAVMSLAILSFAAIATLRGLAGATPIGNYWVILAGAMLGLAHIAGLLAVAVHLYGRRQGYRHSSPWEARVASWISLETMLLAGGVAFMTGFGVLVLVLGYWSQHHFMAIGNMLPAVIGTTLMVIGAQNVLGGFLLAVINGHEADFLNEEKYQPAVRQNHPAQNKLPEDQLAHAKDKDSRAAAG
ncbi:glycosyltransferase family 2 protein [Methyloferula stellata]|uniref:glycosyltransferase family 2 protein n=1 Tax=Methyloferula stellata TaxID=876270 RepID=UPI0003698C27|nr:glycosyltransferase family 2 protein [Methyloferula stellata]